VVKHQIVVQEVLPEDQTKEESFAQYWLHQMGKKTLTSTKKKWILMNKRIKPLMLDQNPVQSFYF
jgi:hypothetical protein